MPARSKTKPSDLDFEQIEMLANFSDCTADYPKLSFEEISMKLRVSSHFSRLVIERDE